ncbi:MAG: ankyrin repeat domain-containing protein [Micavibrio sp.]|nr:ankyrin repeat domain-containing protein [Micavibrio sp.]
MSGLNNLFNTLTGNGINKRNLEGETRLYKAVRSGNIKEVKRLLKDGADPDAADAHGLTPLHQAAYWGETEIVKLLIDAGADVNAENKGKGWTPLHSAAVSGGMRSRREIIDMLHAAGASDAVKDKHGWNAGDYMQLWEQNAAAAEKLKQYMQIPDGLSPQGGHRTPAPPCPPKPC